MEIGTGLTFWDGDRLGGRDWGWTFMETWAVRGRMENTLCLCHHLPHHHCLTCLYMPLDSRQTDDRTDLPVACLEPRPGREEHICDSDMPCCGWRRTGLTWVRLCKFPAWW